MQSAARGLKFCGAWARVACLILAHAANRVTFRGYFKFEKVFQELRIHLPVDSYL